MRGRYHRHTHTVAERRPWYVVDNGVRLEHDRALVSSQYPGLTYQIDETLKRVHLQGVLTFPGPMGIASGIAVRLEFPEAYPKYEPRVYDANSRFPHVADRHFFSDGQCCLWLPPKSIWKPREQDCLLLFLDQSVIFFHKQLICDATGGKECPGKQHSHGDAGYIEYIQEVLEVNYSTLTKFMPLLTGETDIARNVPCLCGSGRKYKFCHLRAIQKLKWQLDPFFLSAIFLRWSFANELWQKHR